MANERSALKQQLGERIKEALRAGEKVKLGALRMLSASVKNREVELRREITDDEFLEVVAREVKRRNEALEAYEGAGRDDLVAKEREEREVLQEYLPEQLSEAETDTLVEEALGATGATSIKEMGKVMGYVMGKAKGRVDGGAVQRKVKQKLGD